MPCIFAARILFSLTTYRIAARQSCVASRMASSTAKRRDPNTLSNYDQFRTRHVTADLAIDFARKRLDGQVTLKLEALETCSHVVLDTNHLDLKSIQVDGSAADWTLDAPQGPYGNALRINLTKEATLGQSVDVTVRIKITCMLASC